MTIYSKLYNPNPNNTTLTSSQLTLTPPLTPTGNLGTVRRFRGPFPCSERSPQTRAARAPQGGGGCVLKKRGTICGCIYVYVYVFMYMCLCIYVYVYVYLYVLNPPIY
jgi:hypothetical protein